MPTTVAAPGTVITPESQSASGAPKPIAGKYSATAPRRSEIRATSRCGGAGLSRVGDFRRRRACIYAEPLDDLLHDLTRMRNDRDHDRVFVQLRLFECREFAVEQRGWDGMLVACRQPARDQVLLTLEIDDADIAALANQDIAIGAFECGAGDGAMIPGAPSRVDPGGNAMQPRPAILICQRLAGVHLPDVGLRVEPVTVLVDPVQPTREHRGNRALAAARDSHHHGDGRIASSRGGCGLGFRGGRLARAPRPSMRRCRGGSLVADHERATGRWPYDTALFRRHGPQVL